MSAFDLSAIPAAPALPALIISGPTASGKSALAVALAQAWTDQPCEIISVDSALIYRGMDIGTAKPTLTEQGGIVHHLMNTHDPAQSYSAAQFVRDATQCITEIHQRGAFPLLVGGTLLYIKALQEGLDDLPAAQPELRAQLEDQARQHGWPHVHQQLQQVDPVTAARLSPQDGQRIQRALEVFLVSGQPISLWYAQSQRQTEPLSMVSLEPEQRHTLHRRIALRTQTMLDHGLIEEVRQLRQRGDLSLLMPSMRCVGYRQVWQALDDLEHQGIALHAKAPDGTYLHDRINAATRQLAKRQTTWLRSMPLRHIVPSETPPEQALEQLLSLAKQARQNVN